MRICYLARPDSVHTKRWLEYFADRGHDVHLVAADRYEVTSNGVTYHPLKGLQLPLEALSQTLNLGPFRRQFNRLVTEIKPDLVHAHYLVGTSLLGALSGFHPFVATAWGSDVLVEARQSRAKRWAAEYILKHADLVTCDADHIQTPLIELGTEPKKIKLIYFGTDTDRFSPRARGGNLCRELGWEDSPLIISLRGLNPIYDVGTFVAAVPLVLREVPEAKFIIVGTGSEEEKLKEQARSLGVWESVCFAGRLSDDDLPRYTASSDIYVSTSLSDAGLAASTAEAMACGLPAVATDFGDNKNWVGDGENGFLFQLSDAEALADRLIVLLKDKEMREKFGRKSRQIIEERNSFKVEMDKMNQLYEGLVATLATKR